MTHSRQEATGGHPRGSVTPPDNPWHLRMTLPPSESPPPPKAPRRRVQGNLDSAAPGRDPRRNTKMDGGHLVSEVALITIRHSGLNPLAWLRGKGGGRICRDRRNKEPCLEKRSGHCQSQLPSCFPSVGRPQPPQQPQKKRCKHVKSLPRSCPTTRCLQAPRCEFFHLFPEGKFAGSRLQTHT